MAIEPNDRAENPLEGASSVPVHENDAALTSSARSHVSAQTGGNSSTSHATAVIDPAVASGDKYPDPGIPPHVERLADKDPAVAKRAEVVVSSLFIISILGSIFTIWAYWALPHGDVAGLRIQNMAIGLGTAFAMLGIGTGVVHWAKVLMPDHEVVEDRHEIRPEADRQDAQEIINTIADESGVKRRPLIRNTLLAAAVVAPLPAINMFRDLGKGKLPTDKYAHTMWDNGVRLAHDPTGVPIRAADLEIGSAVHVIPEGLNNLEEGKLDEKSKSVVLLMRLNPEDLTQKSNDWGYQGIVAYSKICTHVGCPVALYEQQTHHLLCPCHQSTFDLTQDCKVIFGPANRPLPQLPITVDNEGYLVAKSDFHEPIGPSYWERPNA
ncbi:MAG: Rieske 2Fe-2S domain-containing protein [Micrococcaceae bacterium]